MTSRNTSTCSLAGVFIVGVPRDADNRTDLANAVLRIALERHGRFPLLFIDALWPSAIAATSAGGSQSRMRAFPNQMALRLDERRKQMKDQLATRARGISCKLRKPTLRCATDEEQELWNEFSRLLVNAILYYNMIKLSQAVTRSRAAGRYARSDVVDGGVAGGMDARQFLWALHLQRGAGGCAH